MTKEINHPATPDTTHSFIMQTQLPVIFIKHWLVYKLSMLPLAEQASRKGSAERGHVLLVEI